MKFFIPIFFLFFIPINLYATVGGPVVFYDFKYNPTDESIYYTMQDYDARGCPPALYKMSLVNESKDVVFSCEEGFSLLNDEGLEYESVDWPEQMDYLINQKIDQITSDFKPLQKINLKENNISIDINFLKDNFSEGYSEEDPISRSFSADIYQNGEIIDSKDINSCYLEDPFLFEGYAIPGFEKKIMLLMSAKFNCWEGGYVSDSVYIVEDVDNINKDLLGPVSYRDGGFIIEPDKDTLVVYESDNIKLEEKSTSTTSKNIVEQEVKPKQKDSYVVLIITNLISLIVGLFIGRYIFTQTKIEE